MSTDEEWSLWRGALSGFMQVWPRDVAERMLRKRDTRIEFITHGDKETLTAILELNNAQIRAQQGESE